MNDGDQFFVDPRIHGIREHHARAVWFLQGAETVPNEAGRFRLLMAALYSCRACIEIILEAAEKEYLAGFKQSDPRARRTEFEKTLISRLPRYYLLEKIRIHDFHRFGLVPPDPRVKSFFGGGPIKLSASKGIAAIQEGQDGPQECTTGNSFIKEQRALRIQDGRFFDDEKREYVPLGTIVIDFANALPAVLIDFEKMMKPAANEEPGVPAA